MRVLLVHGGHELYGSDRSLLRIAEAAAADGRHVEVLVPAAGPLADALRTAGVVVHVRDPLMLRRAELRGVRAPVTPLRWAARAVALLVWARGRRFDLVHSNVAPMLGGALLARLWRAPHVWHVREVFTQPPVVVRAFTRLLRGADVVVANSSSVAAQFADPALTARIVVVHSGADVPAGLTERRPLAEPPLRLICVGRLNAWKGQDVLVEALAALRARGVDARLDLVGDVFGGEAHYRETLRRRVAALGLDDAVRLLGERPDAPALVAAADVAVVPSRTPEPFGRALVEAMALGRPVVATDAGGPAEIVTHEVDGLLVPMGDAAALADAVARLAGDPDAARTMGERGRRRAADFGTARMTAEVLALWDRLLPAPAP